ncbi:ribosomal protein P1 [Rhizophagus irregularis]|uniref:60s acidic ribosomal protein P1 n=2 Tax=Rhizophagus irregularis TaxID=588596 RepID=U9UFL1_RHIID|nr:60s acidic ribosomal protein P1 [Rhizophagus irregularis DAOM 181602=DAOM 197198]EXX50737.1 ribosomal protein P1A [Rhizophagus irregularis DAOM 197198w]POG74204.1 60s acidic ribosomal protein P1 [Rhizophagus irregularis DAOM 181602=DAOM 197198]UZO17457.1 60S acidic ribosomal protein P1 [Rhizophagus irregularis]GBC24083.1 60s acidic ribosomal protein P1 [Rhizophagus irregularis DAOM 181602=DAOM 197198]|eukprot:XP_025181070.1 60s acidic ribosomal protein P1 [Rhizophagus irregularis DAOM 181602=DAOM 197198]
MSTSELAIVYSALILADDGIDITADKLQALTKAAGIDVEPVWANLFAKALEGKSVNDLLMNVGSPGAVAPSGGGAAVASGGAAEEKKEEEKPAAEEKEESDEDMGFGLFD